VAAPLESLPAKENSSAALVASERGPWASKRRPYVRAVVWEAPPKVAAVIYKAVANRENGPNECQRGFKLNVPLGPYILQAGVCFASAQWTVGTNPSRRDNSARIDTWMCVNPSFHVEHVLRWRAITEGAKRGEQTCDGMLAEGAGGLPGPPPPRIPIPPPAATVAAAVVAGAISKSDSRRVRISCSCRLGLARKESDRAASEGADADEVGAGAGARADCFTGEGARPTPGTFSGGCCCFMYG